VQSIDDRPLIQCSATPSVAGVLQSVGHCREGESPRVPQLDRGNLARPGGPQNRFLRQAEPPCRHPRIDPSRSWLVHLRPPRPSVHNSALRNSSSHCPGFSRVTGADELRGNALNADDRPLERSYGVCPTMALKNGSRIPSTRSSRTGAWRAAFDLSAPPRGPTRYSRAQGEPDRHSRVRRQLRDRRFAGHESLGGSRMGHGGPTKPNRGCREVEHPGRQVEHQAPRPARRPRGCR
jgi:hypothetical protein